MEESRRQMTEGRGQRAEVEESRGQKTDGGGKRARGRSVSPQWNSQRPQ